jgi:transcriptional regulator with XRE-family HTH domain
MKPRTLAAFLLQKRRDLGLTQLEFAQRLGVSRVYYHFLEVGRYNNPGIKLIRKIAEITSTPIPEINKLIYASI